MKLKNKVGKALSFLTTAVMCFTMLPGTSQTSSSAASPGDRLSVGNGQPSQHKGVSDGYSYEIWIDSTGGSGTMTLGQGGTFKAEWSASVPSGNFLARRGKDYGSTTKATECGDIVLNYEADYRQTGSASGNSRLCVYGWFQNKGAAGNVPLVEYYIIEDWVDWVPDAAGKMVTIDGAQYKIFQMDHTGPTINGGSETFKQYFSVRQSKRKSGTITVSEHFKVWEQQGWGIGNLYEVALNAEGWQSSGVADVTLLNFDGEPPKPTEPPKPIEPDEEGNYFYDTFESGAGDWKGRGSASVKVDSSVAAAGSKSLYVSGREDNWNGAEIELDPYTFIAGNTFSFSAGVLQNTESTAAMKMTLQYTDSNGEEKYDEVATATAKNGVWTKLENTSYTIPAGANNLRLYVECEDSLTDFYIDEIKGSKEGVKSSIEDSGEDPTQGEDPTEPVTPTNPPADDALAGDVNCDGKVTIADAAALLQNLANGDKYKLTDEGMVNGDVDGNAGLTASDAIEIQKYDAGLVSKLTLTGRSSSTTKTTTHATTKLTTTSTSAAASITPQEYMAEAKANFTANVPSDVKSGDGGTTKKITYYSKKAQRNKPANVWLPPNYSTSEKYPVVYMNHGVMGGEDDMLEGWSIREMATNLIKKGEVKPFIIVFTQMYTDPNADRAGGITQEAMDRYDDFLYDLTESLMPYMAENYSVAEGRENTAIAGFSMGGRESLFIGMKAADKIGYVCASSPAPGIVPAQDMFLNHRGSMTESEFKFSEPYLPYLLMIGGGTNDGVVGTFPKQYHELYDKNGVDNIWFEVQGGGHDASVGTPLFYNFFRNLFKA